MNGIRGTPNNHQGVEFAQTNGHRCANSLKYSFRDYQDIWERDITKTQSKEHHHTNLMFSKLDNSTTRIRLFKS